MGLGAYIIALKIYKIEPRTDHSNKLLLYSKNRQINNLDNANTYYNIIKSICWITVSLCVKFAFIKLGLNNYVSTDQGNKARRNLVLKL